MGNKTFNNLELGEKINEIYLNIKDNQESESWDNDSIEPVEVDFTWYDNRVEQLGYAIDFGDYFTALYGSIEEAEADFDLIQEVWKNKKIYVHYYNSSDDQPREHMGTLSGHAKNKAVLVTRSGRSRKGDSNAIHFCHDYGVPCVGCRCYCEGRCGASGQAAISDLPYFLHGSSFDSPTCGNISHYNSISRRNSRSRKGRFFVLIIKRHFNSP